MRHSPTGLFRVWPTILCTDTLQLRMCEGMRISTVSSAGGHNIRMIRPPRIGETVYWAYVCEDDLATP
jgi:hypothetical protein